MKLMQSIKLLPALTLSLGMVLSVPAVAQEGSPGQRLVDQIIEDIVHRTADAAREEITRQTGIDPFERGYGLQDDYRPMPSDAKDENRRELLQLVEEHDWKIAKLEKELQQKLNKAETQFRREAAKENKAGKIAEKREKLREKVKKAHDKFEERVREENSRFDRKRSKIIAKLYD
jgi:hypothetical protein